MTTTFATVDSSAKPAKGSVAAHRHLQRKCACGILPSPTGECETCRDKRLSLRRKPNFDAGGRNDSSIPPIVHEVLRSPGQPLEAATRAFMEPRFGHDFSQVQVHTDTHARESARATNSRAYTVGQHIVFGADRYAPGQESGRRLLAHELAHTIQQGNNAQTVQPAKAIDPVDSPLEREADRAAQSVLSGERAVVSNTAVGAGLQRQPAGGAPATSEPDFSQSQLRGGQPRAAILDLGRRGEDEVRMAVFRYLCECAGRNFSRTRVQPQLQPGPGVTIEYCRGRSTLRVTGQVVPNGFPTGRATARVDLNVAPAGGTGARVSVEGEARNTGPEPQVGGRADLRIRLPGGQEGGVSGEIFRGTNTGQIDTQIGAGVRVGGVVLGGQITNPQDDRRRTVGFTIGGTLPGQNVQEQTCRECRCPVVYNCVEDVRPRDYEELEPYNFDETSRLRYYFQLDTNQDTRDQALKSASQQMLDEVTRRVGAGARVSGIIGFASPEDNRDRPVPNQQLSLSRGQRLRDLLAGRLGANSQLPEPQAGGELFGRVATITPGSRLADAMLEAGFGDPEDVSTFLLGTDIPNAQLADQFLALLNRVTEPSERLRLFGLAPTSPTAARLLAAIGEFIARRGRGRRPWEGIFGYLRFATVELTETREATRTVPRRTTGSLTPVGEALCNRFAQQAEDENRFGPAEPAPQNPASCPSGPRNRPEYERKCNY